MIDPMTAMYSAIESVAEGKVAEIELEFQQDSLDGTENRLTITIRNKVRELVSPPDDD